MISAHAGAFLQENLLGLPSLPTEEELTKLREARRQEALRRAEQMRQAAELERKRREEQAASLEERERSNAAAAGNRRVSRESIATPQPSVHFSRKSEDGGVKMSGWKPTEVMPGRNANEDPMIQQMNIIRGYIKQAQEAQKWDEVQMLKENLKELQRVYWEQQHKQQQK